MANVTRDSFNKADCDKADVEAEGNRRVQIGIAVSFTVEDCDAVWVLVTILKKLS